MLNVEQLMLGDFMRLRFVQRYNRYPRTHNESVAEHMYFVSLFSMLIARELCIESKMKINWHFLMSACLLHDADEAVMGDIDGPLKQRYPALKQILDECGMVTMTTILGKCDATRVDEAVDAYIGAKDCGVEGQIIAIADYMSVLQFAAIEMLSGNVLMIATMSKDVIVSDCKRLFDNCISELKPITGQLIGVVRGLYGE